MRFFKKFTVTVVMLGLGGTVLFAQMINETPPRTIRKVEVVNLPEPFLTMKVPVFGRGTRGDSCEVGCETCVAFSSEPFEVGGYDVTGVAVHELRPDGLRTVTQVARTEFRNFPDEPWWTMPEAGAEARFVSRPLCSDEVFGIEYFSVLLRQR